MGNTPRIIYKYFLFTYRLNYYIAFGSIFVFLFYSIFLVSDEELKSNKFENQDRILYIFLLSLYFGVINRDLAEICAETIAIRGGFYGPDAIARKAILPTKCGICSEDMLLSESNMRSIEGNIAL